MPNLKFFQVYAVIDHFYAFFTEKLFLHVYSAENKRLGKLSFGVHDFKAKKGVFSTRIPLKEVQGKTYKEFKIGSAVLKNGMSVYTGSIEFNRKQIRDERDLIYVDSLRFDKAD